MKSKTSVYLAEVRETMTAEAEEGGVKIFHNDKYNAVTFITKSSAVGITRRPHAAGGGRGVCYGGADSYFVHCKIRY
jgi:hypothetical protein